MANIRRSRPLLLHFLKQGKVRKKLKEQQVINMSYTKKIKQALFRKEAVKVKFGKLCEDYPDLLIIAIDPESGNAMSAYRNKLVAGIMPPRVVKTTLKYSSHQKEIFNFLEQICHLMGFNPYRITEGMRKITDAFYINLGYILSKLSEFRQSIKR